jgi:hypothetical protein
MSILDAPVRASMLKPCTVSMNSLATSSILSHFDQLASYSHQRTEPVYRLILLTEDPSPEELNEEAIMRGCTLDVLDCTYGEARTKAESHTRAVLARTGGRGPEWEWVPERLTALRMMDEMYGPNGEIGYAGK